MTKLENGCYDFDSAVQREIEYYEHEISNIVNAIKTNIWVILKTSKQKFGIEQLRQDNIEYQCGMIKERLEAIKRLSN